MNSKEFRLMRRVNLGGIPVVELRAALAQLRDDSVVRIDAYEWRNSPEGGQVLTYDRSRIPFELQVASDGSELSIKVLSSSAEDQLMRQQVHSRRWGVPPPDVGELTDEDFRQLSRIDPHEAAAAKSVAASDIADDERQERLRQQREERRRDRVRRRTLAKSYKKRNV